MTKDDVFLLLVLGVGALLAALGAALLAMAFAILLTAPAGAQTVIGKTTACGMTEQDLLQGRKHLVATPRARDVIVAEINKGRARGDNPQSEKVDAGVDLQVDKLVVLPIEGAPQRIAVAMFRNRCAIPGMVRAFPLASWAAWLSTLGIGADDFVREENA